MLTGKRFNGEEAYAKGLVNQLRTPEEMEGSVENMVNELRTSSPQAIASCKDLIFHVTKSSGFNEILDYTARMIADARASEQGQEGMAAFLEKRKPSWAKKRQNVVSR
jgi:methylglutaconyl-CoA hydratase